MRGSGLSELMVGERTHLWKLKSDHYILLPVLDTVSPRS